MSVSLLIIELMLISNDTQLDGVSYSSHNASGSTHGVNSVGAVQKWAFELASSKEPLEAEESESAKMKLQSRYARIYL